MKVRPEVSPFIVASILSGLLIWILLALLGAAWRTALTAGFFLGASSVAYMLFFFRDPDMVTPSEPGAVVAGASGKLAKVTEVTENEYIKGECLRISIFLSLFDVHVNRFPISGRAEFLGYFPGKRLFTFEEKSSDVNQHNAILVRGEGTVCLVRQIVGPVCRRVVYWLSHDEETEVQKGDRLGMMKFGSRLDMYFPKGEIEMVARIGEQVTAGETVIARIVRKDKP